MKKKRTGTQLTKPVHSSGKASTSQSLPLEFHRQSKPVSKSLSEFSSQSEQTNTTIDLQSANWTRSQTFRALQTRAMAAFEDKFHSSGQAHLALVLHKRSQRIKKETIKKPDETNGTQDAVETYLFLEFMHLLLQSRHFVISGAFSRQATFRTSFVHVDDSRTVSHLGAACGVCNRVRNWRFRTLIVTFIIVGPWVQHFKHCAQMISVRLHPHSLKKIRKRRSRIGYVAQFFRRQSYTY